MSYNSTKTIRLFAISMKSRADNVIVNCSVSVTADQNAISRPLLDKGKNILDFRLKNIAGLGLQSLSVQVSTKTIELFALVFHERDSMQLGCARLVDY